MIKKMAWNTFKNTGNVDTFLELRQLENLEENNAIIGQKVKANEYSKNERDNNIRK